MEQVCNGACIFGKCPNKVCIKYQQAERNAVQLKSDMRILTDSMLPHITTDKNGYGIAVDIGTTTVVAYLYDLSAAQCLGVQSALNPQVTLGVDVISRIKFCGDFDDGLLKMQQAIIVKINDLSAALLHEEGIDPDKISHLVLTGNTTMLHLLSGISPVSMGYSPFEPASLFGNTILAKDIGIALPSADAYLVGCISSFVGGDITSAILASGLYKSDEICLLMDIGTNGELALGNRDTLLVTSTAAGPAFEGAEITKGMAGVKGAVNSVFLRDGKIEYTVIGNAAPVGLCGSGILDLMSIAVLSGLVDETGRICSIEELDGNGSAERYLRQINDESTIFVDENVYLTQSDIRQIQTAKAAVAAGVLALVKSAGIEMDAILKVYIAGGFGNYMDKESAVRVGLIDKKLQSKINPIGNAAGSGAILALLNDYNKKESETIAKRGRHVELGGDSYFMEKYVDCMYFE